MTLEETLRMIVREEVRAAMRDLATDDALPDIDLTLRQAAKLLGLSVETVRTLVVEEKMPGAYKRRRREWRIPGRAIAAYQQLERDEFNREKLHRIVRAPRVGRKRVAVPVDKRGQREAGGVG